MALLYRVQTVFTGIAGSPYYNTLHFNSSAGTAGAAVTSAGGFWSAVDGIISTLVDWDISGEVDVINDATGEIVAVENATPQSGTGGLSGNLLPPATQGLIRWRTGVFAGGREIRGKTFVPGLTVTSATDGQMSTAAVTALENAATALATTPAAQLVVYSRTNGQSAPVTASSAWGQFAVLRSRRD